MTQIVKRRGHKEKFDKKKLYASVYAACLNVHMHEGEAELVADKVSEELVEEIGHRHEVASHEIFKQTTEILKKYNTDAAFMYATHRDIS